MARDGATSITFTPTQGKAIVLVITHKSEK